MTAPDTQIVQWRPQRGPARRVEFEPAAGDGYIRRERVWTGCRWRTVGTEAVDRVRFDDSTEAERRCGITIAGP